MINSNNLQTKNKGKLSAVSFDLKTTTVMDEKMCMNGALWIKCKVFLVFFCLFCLKLWCDCSIFIFGVFPISSADIVFVIFLKPPKETRTENDVVYSGFLPYMRVHFTYYYHSDMWTFISFKFNIYTLKLWWKLMDFYCYFYYFRLEFTNRKT